MDALKRSLATAAGQREMLLLICGQKETGKEKRGPHLVNGKPANSGISAGWSLPAGSELTSS